MGDRTWGQIVVLELGAEYPDQIQAFLDVIRETGLSYQGGDGDVDPFKTLMVGPDCFYGDDQVTCGFVAEHLAALAEAAPNATWWGYESPYGDWLGEVLMHTPALGVWRGNCDDNGDPVFHAEKIRDAMDSDQSLDDLLGVAWTDAIVAGSRRE